MSYDLVVFNSEVTPKDRTGFIAWYEKQVEWTEDHNYNDPKVSAANLKAWFFEMIKTFPAMNGPYASDDFDDPNVTDYSIGKNIIYAAFAWSVAENAYNTMLKLAEKHKVGFFAASNDSGDVWEPNSGGNYECIHRN